MPSKVSTLDLIKLTKGLLNKIGKLGDRTDDDILAYVDEVSQAVKNYCQIPEILYEMRYIVAHICCDYAVYDLEAGKDINLTDLEFDPSDVSSVKIGDTTIGLGDKYRSNERRQILNAHTYDLDSLLLDYRGQLNRFRRIW